MALAFVCTFWLYGPVITVGLWAAERVRPGRSAFGRPSSVDWKRMVTRVGVLVAAGFVLALIALPFHLGTVRLPSDLERFGAGTAVVMILSRAVAVESFARLFVLTLVFALAARSLPRRGTAALAVAIAAAAVVDLVVLSAGIPSLGLPGAFVAPAYAVVRFLIPAVAYGYLFWQRGLAAAVGAHVAADLWLALLAR